MKPLSEITFGFSDAENYRRRENKGLFNKIFLRTDALDKLCDRNVFFLVGEKGTGKTAYAVYLSNIEYKNNKAIHKFIRETDYTKFINLKAERNLSLSEYTDIWKVIIYLLISQAIYESCGTIEFLTKYKKFKGISDAIKEYYQNAFSPEIPVAFQFIEDTNRAVELIAKYEENGAQINIENNKQTRHDKQRFQTNLLYIERKFREALSSIGLGENHVLFIDGIDIRPANIPYGEYLDCVKGLANAIWSVNNDIFPGIRDSKGRMRAVLLTRPDIFNSLGLQNRNTKLKDNSVILDWRTNYSTHRQSELFRLADRIFSSQQSEHIPVGDCWDHYFPFNATSVHSEQKTFTSFVIFMRYSFYRPRDILTMLDILRDLFVAQAGVASFSYENLMSSDFRRRYGDYLLGEVKDSLSFYYDETEFDLFLKFFEYLDGAKSFSYDAYTTAFARFSFFIKEQNVPRPNFMKSANEFLQFLYDLNIICFIEETEDEKFIRWCFVERGFANISPKVKINMNYEIHYGLANALNTGKAIINKRKGKVDKSENIIQNGTIKIVYAERNYGFIQQKGLPVDIFFRIKSDESELKDLQTGTRISYYLRKDKDGRLCAEKIKLMDK